MTTFTFIRSFLVRIFPHSDWIWSDTEYLYTFSPNAGKHGPEKLRIRRSFTQCFGLRLILIILQSPRIAEYIKNLIQSLCKEVFYCSRKLSILFLWQILRTFESYSAAVEYGQVFVKNCWLVGNDSSVSPQRKLFFYHNIYTNNRCLKWRLRG